MHDPDDYNRGRWPYSPRIVHPPKLSTAAQELAIILGLSLFGVLMVLAVLWLTVGEG